MIFHGKPNIFLKKIKCLPWKIAVKNFFKLLNYEMKNIFSKSSFIWSAKE